MFGPLLHLKRSRTLRSLSLHNLLGHSKLKRCLRRRNAVQHPAGDHPVAHGGHPRRRILSGFEDDENLRSIIDQVGAGSLIYGSDYPHSDMDWGRVDAIKNNDSIT